MLDRSGAVPLHSQLSCELRDQILDGRLTPGARLPSERELCELFGVSRTTVREAVAGLIKDGLVHTTVGKGTYVAEATVEEHLDLLCGFSEDMRRRGRTPGSRLLGSSVVNADLESAAQLRIPKGAEVFELRRLRLVDGLPVALQVARVPHHLAMGIQDHDFSVRSLYDVLRTEYHIRMGEAELVAVARLAVSEEHRLLEVGEGSAVLDCRQTTYCETGDVIEFCHSVIRGDRYELHARV